jgi:hypothetical protein
VTPEAILVAIDDCGAWIAFCVTLAVPAIVGTLCVLFAGLLVHRAWRWLATHTWRDVIVMSERKALE